MKTTALILVLSLAAAALGQSGPPPAAVTTGEVRAETVRAQVTGVATVKPWQRSVLSTEIAGLVRTYPLREGDAVTAGKTVVCELEHSSLDIDLAEAKALLARARAEAATALENAETTKEEQKTLLDQAERELERAKELFADRVINQSELDRAESEAATARHRYERAEQSWRLAKEGNDPAQQALVAEVRRAEANLARVEDKIAKTRIVTPLTGRVVRRMTEVGAWVTPGGPVVEVISIDPVLVEVGVNEKDISGIEVGSPARITVSAHPDRTFSGKVRFLVPEADPRSRSFPAQIEVPNADAALLPGMFARVSIDAGEPRDVLTVPRDAVVKGPQGEAVVTFGDPTEVDMGGKTMKIPTARYVPVKTGISVDGRVEVSGEGLAPKMPVVTTGNEMLRPGQPLIPDRGGSPR